MKRTISLFLCAAMLICCLAGCSKTSTEMTEENITATAETVFTALKEFDTEALGQYVSSSTLSTIMSYAESHEQFAELGRAMFENLTYEITAIDTENATVTVSVMNKYLYQAATDFVNDLLSDYSTLQLLVNLSNDTWLDENLSVLEESIDSASMMSEAQEITITITQGEENLIFEFDEDAEDGVSGGALGAIKSAIGI